MRANLKSVSVYAAAAAAAISAMSASNLSAKELHWMGGPGDILASNYAQDGAPPVGPVLPVSGDILDLGGVNSAITTTGTGVPGRVRIGHNFTSFVTDPTTPPTQPVPTNPSPYAGPATLTMSTGTLSLGGSGTSGTYAGLRAGLVIGYNANGTFNHQGGTTNVTENVVIGADDPNDIFTGAGTGTLNISGGTFRDRRNDMLVGHGNPGVVTISGGGNLHVVSNTLTHNENIDLYVGYTTASTLSKTGPGVLLVNNNFLIGSGSTVTLSAGTTTTKFKTIVNGYPSDAPAGNIFVGRSGSNNDVLNINGTATVNIGHRFLLSSAGGSTNATVNQSAGTVNVVRNLAVSDSANTSSSVYNLSGGSLTANLDLSRVGRRGNGKMFQSGGTATFNVGLAIGDDEDTAVGETSEATGLYEISGGTLTTNIASGNALRVGTAGNGTFVVVGDDGIVDVNGGFIVNNTVEGVGNLSYRFETGDLLSQIDVSGIATFASGTGLSLDTTLATPTLTSYDLLKATDIIDNGLTFTGPAGWSYSIVPDGGIEILRAFFTAPPSNTLYWDIDGANPGSGGASPSENWNGTTANFTADAEGDSGTTTAATTASSDVVFAAGTDGTGSYTVTVSGTQAANSVQIAHGNVTLAGGALAVGAFNVAEGASGTITSTVNGNGSGAVTKTGAGSLTLASANPHTGATTVEAGTLVIGHADAVAASASLTVADGAAAQIAPGLPKAATVKSLSLAGDAVLDMTSGAMIIKTGDLATVAAAVASGATLDLTWTGAGINSSVAATDPNGITAIGFATGADYVGGGLTDFAGVAYDDDDILVRVTYYGDSDLNGDTNLDDYPLFIFGLEDPSAPQTWYYGDYNYSGEVDIDDFPLFIAGLENDPIQTAALADLIEMSSVLSADNKAAMLGMLAAVPEPTTFALFSAAACGGLLRRRRRAISSR